MKKTVNIDLYTHEQLRRFTLIVIDQNFETKDSANYLCIMVEYIIRTVKNKNSQGR